MNPPVVSLKGYADVDKKFFTSVSNTNKRKTLTNILSKCPLDIQEKRYANINLLHDNVLCKCT